MFGGETMNDDENIILSKKQNAVDVFTEVCKRSSSKISMKEIKRELETRYEGDSSVPG